MNANHFFAATGERAPKTSSKLSRPTDRPGGLVTGRIVNLLTGQSYGFIRLPNAREVYFHRADLQEGTAFNDLQVGDTVKFELFDDAVSGARALRVERQRRPK